MEEKKISSAVIKRLPRYYRYLSELLEKGIDRISSHELSKKMNVTASQIRQDFNNFGGFGQQGYGYNVSYLHDEIGKILGLEHNYNVIIIGAGNLGRALANYGGFTKRGFQMAGIFDVDKEKIGKKINDIPVYSIEDIEVFVKEHPVHIAALTVPKDQGVEDRRETGGSRSGGVLEFCVYRSESAITCCGRKCSSGREFDASFLSSVRKR